MYTAVSYFATSYEGFNFSQRNKRVVTCKALEKKVSIVSPG